MVLTYIINIVCVHIMLGLHDILSLEDSYTFSNLLMRITEMDSY